MKKYEYKIFKTKPEGFWGTKVESEKLETEINKLGSEGWELVSTMDTNAGYGATQEIILFFKRESRF
ncbi:MAG: DUF4177 domain-containing protein [Leadbetterella sp.]|nr:DUF4177 domain-containing protein [Leadbetterella sp.]